jgi:glycosyltransferase involved in cell wall biosynthesis
VKLIYLPAIPGTSFETISHSLAIAVQAAVKHKEVDLIHFYNAASAFALPLLKLAKIPVIITVDGIEWNRAKWGWLAKKVWKLATWLSVNLADTIVCDSGVVRNYFESKYNKNIKYIPYGAKYIQSNCDVYKSFGLTDKGYLLFVGRFVQEKSVDKLIDSYNMIDTDVPLVLIGDNENDREYVDNLKNRAGKNILFLGYRYGEEYESLLSHAKIYVSASVLEGTSPSLLAAMGAKVCCLVNGIAENRETGGESVMYFDGSKEDLVNKLQILLNNEEKVGEYSNKGFNRVKNYYDWDVVAKQYMFEYELLLDSKREK